MYEKAISKDDTLRTLVLNNAQRFLHADYVKERTAYEEKKALSIDSKKPDLKTFWRAIPGELFYIAGSEIASVNVRHTETVQLIQNPTLTIELTTLRARLEEARRTLEKSKQNMTAQKHHSNE